MPGYLFRFYEYSGDEEEEATLTDEDLSKLELFIQDELDLDVSIAKRK